MPSLDRKGNPRDTYYSLHDGICMDLWESLVPNPDEEEDFSTTRHDFLKSIQDAATNSYYDGISREAWRNATLARIN